MKLHLSYLASSALVLVALNDVYGQYAPPPPPTPFQGFLNEYLRKDNPYMNKWDFGGSARARYEVKDGFIIPGSPGSLDFRAHNADVDNAFFLERFRIRAGYTDKWWSALVEGQSSLAQGDQRFAYANVPAVPGTVARKDKGPESDVAQLHQAYVTIGNHKEFPLSTKIGRMEMSYGDERLIGAFGWNNIGRSFDGGKVRWQNAWFGADFFVTRPVIPVDQHWNAANDYDWFSGMYGSTTKIPKTLLEFYFLVRNTSGQAASAVPSPQFPQPSARDIYTPGIRVKSRPGELGHWDYLLETAYQFGNFQDTRPGVNTPTSRLDQSAYMACVQAGYTFADAWASPRLALEFDYSSGDKNPFDSKHGTFDNLFPTNHKFYGYMDFFSLQNVQTVRGIFQLKPTPRMTVALEGNGFWLANTHDSFYNVGGVARGGTTPTPAGTGYAVNPNYGTYVGSELDLVAGYALTRFATLESGYGHFFTGTYVDQSLASPNFGSKDANWFYIQATVNF